MVPAARLEEVKLACPAGFKNTFSFRPPGPVKETIPSGTPVAGALAVTVAVTVTDSPMTAVFGVRSTVVVVDAGLTVTGVPFIEGRKFWSPE
ncbi:hypothetical protein D3C75_1173270 [compost metagenome]